MLGSSSTWTEPRGLAFLIGMFMRGSPWAYALEPVFELVASFEKRSERLLVRLPVASFMRFDDAVGQLGRGGGIEVAQSPAHFRVENERSGDLLINPRIDLAGCRRPSKCVRDMRLDLPNALVAVLEHALVPFRVEDAGSGLERDLLGQRANFAGSAGLIGDVDGRHTSAASARGCAAHAAEESK